MKHYRYLTELFGAPNGLCSSITESKHIPAVKEPWRRSSRNKPLGEMLLTNQRLDKLSACREDFKARGMLIGSCAAPVVMPLEPPPDQPENPILHVDDSDSEPAEGPRADAQVILAKKKGVHKATYIIYNFMTQPPPQCARLQNIYIKLQYMLIVQSSLPSSAIFYSVR